MVIHRIRNWDLYTALYITKYYRYNIFMKVKGLVPILLWMAFAFENPDFNEVAWKAVKLMTTTQKHQDY